MFRREAEKEMALLAEEKEIDETGAEEDEQSEEAKKVPPIVNVTCQVVRRCIHYLPMCYSDLQKVSLIDFHFY